MLVHIDYERALREHIAIPVDFPTELLLQVETTSLPTDWNAPPGLPHTQALGDAWISQNASAVLAVPSRIVPAERNYLLNPEHPDFAQAEIGHARPFHFDSRLLKR